MKHSPLVVPPEMAKDLKKLGFSEPCIAYYTIQSKEQYYSHVISEQGYNTKNKIFGKEINYNSSFYEREGTISAPFWSQVDKFLCEKYDIIVHIHPCGEDYEETRIVTYFMAINQAKTKQIKNEKT